MGKSLFFDAFNGVAGDMILGALVDLGMPMELLSEELRKLPLPPYEIKTSRIEREGLAGVDLQVVLDETDPHRHSHHGNHHSHHRHFGDIRKMILESELDDRVKNTSLSIFTRLAEAEAKVHGSTVDEVHFHEVGAVDSIVDIVGSCVGFWYFGIEEFASSSLELGGGTVTFSHGTWPVPAPATAELVKGFPVRLGLVEKELTTPTGAAIVTTLASREEVPASFKIEMTGMGAGDRDIAGIPNMLRLMIGETPGKGARMRVPGTGSDCGELGRVTVLEANIDDMLSEDLGFFMERAQEKGALDVFFTPVFMKKNRPAYQLTVLAPQELEAALVSLVFAETSTMGIRRTVVERYTLEREWVDLDSEFGGVRLKKGVFDGKTVVLSPEFEDLKKIARQKNLSLKEVRSKINKRVSDENFE